MTKVAVERERVMEFVSFAPLSGLRPWDRNYRTGDHDAIERSLSQFGLLGALRVRQGVVIAGNQTLATLQRMYRKGASPPKNVAVDTSGEWLIPTISADHLSDSEATAFAIADNRTHDLGADNEEQLGVLLSELVPLDLLEVAGYDLSAVEVLLDTEVADSGRSDIDLQAVEDVDVSRADELQERWNVQPGQVWVAGSHVLACGSSSDADLVSRAFGDRKASLIWTDPPYGVDYVTGRSEISKASGGKPSRHKKIALDESPSKALEAFSTALALAPATKGAAIYATVPSGPLLPRFIEAMGAGGYDFRHLLVWVKDSLVLGRSDYHYRHEPILYGWKSDGAHYFTSERTHSSVFEVARPKRSDEHPTMKPIELIRQMVANSTRPGDVVYDPFLGSGSTASACAIAGRASVGIEIHPPYVAVALERMAIAGETPHVRSAA